MDLYILRHGKAEDIQPGRSDADRALTKKGREEIAQVARWMAAHGIGFDRIAASPFVRAQETAMIVADVVQLPGKVDTWDLLVPGGYPDEVCRRLNRYANSSAILLVGHEPLLSSLVSRIITGDSDAAIVMTKGGLAKIRDYSFTQRPAGELHWLLTAKQMAGAEELR